MKQVIINLGAGTIESGFNSVNIELKYAGKPQWADRSSLPANLGLKQLLKGWQNLYPATIRAFGEISLAPVFEADTVTNVSKQDIKGINHDFRLAMNEWLNHGRFGEVVGRLRSDLNVVDRILIVIVSEQLDIWRLPWHYWNFFDDHQQAVEVFCKPRNAQVTSIKPQYNGRVNTLGLIGQDPQLDLNLDFFKTLRHANRPQILKTISAQEVGDALNKTIPWDIFIFNGHGNTEEDEFSQEGIIYLDNDTPLEISNLKLEIKKAVDRGLQIAIFNCCSGLGLAEQLSDLNIPYIIVMREKILNEVAQKFLQDLLDRYSQGNSFPEAFKFARERLRLSSSGFAKVGDWLPILFHNPLSRQVTWRDLSTTVWREAMPTKIRAVCTSISHPQHQIWKMIGISLFTSLFLTPLISLVTNPLDDQIVNNIQTTREAKISPQQSQVTIVNYNSFSVGDILSNDSDLIDKIDKVEKITKPLVWGIDLSIERKPQIFDRTNVIHGCDRNGDCTKNRQSSIAAIVKQTNPPPQPLQNLDWNSDSLTKNSLEQILTKIDRLEFDNISNLSAAEIKQRFAGKIIIVGNSPAAAKIDPVERKAIEIDRIIRANHPQQPLKLPDSFNNVAFYWIFSWSVLAGLAISQRRWKLFLPLTLGSQIAIAIILLSQGEGVPIVTTSIQILLVSGVIYTIEHISFEQPA